MRSGNRLFDQVDDRSLVVERIRDLDEFVTIDEDMITTEGTRVAVLDRDFAMVFACMSEKRYRYAAFLWRC